MDDSFISFRYGQRFFEGKGLTWNDNEYIEGYSNILWTILVAFLDKFIGNPIISANLLAIISICSSFYIIAFSSAKNVFSKGRAYVGGLFLCTSSSLIIHSMSGIEHSFLSSILIVTLYYVNLLNTQIAERKLLYIAGILLAVLACIRIDAFILVCAILGISFILNIKDQSKKFLIFGISFFPAIAIFCHIVFRYFYYNKLVPHTASVKVSFNALRYSMGYSYVLNGISYTYSIWLLGLFAAVFLIYKGRIKLVLLCMLTSFVWLVYLIFSGGDIFFGRRQFFISYIPIILLITETAFYFQTKNLRSIFYYSIITIAASFNFYLNTIDNQNYNRVKRKTWVTDARSLGENLHSTFGHINPTLAVDAAGSLPFYTKFKSIDMLGLTNDYIKRASKVIGTRAVGHELGSGLEVIKREPDIIAFNGALGGLSPMFKSGRELLNIPKFKNEYKPIRIKTESYNAKNYVKSVLYFRAFNGKLGIRNNAFELVIPAYLFETNNSKFFIDNKLVSYLSKNDAARITNIEIPKGNWKVSILTTAKTKAFDIQFSNSESKISFENNILRTTTSTNYEIKVKTKEAHFHFYELVVKKL